MYWKLSQISLFGRIEDTRICFGDCLNFIRWILWFPQLDFHIFETLTNSWHEFTFIEFVVFSFEVFPFQLLLVRLSGFEGRLLLIASPSTFFFDEGFMMLFVRLGGFEGFEDFVWVLFGRVGILDILIGQSIKVQSNWEFKGLGLYWYYVMDRPQYTY